MAPRHPLARARLSPGCVACCPAGACVSRSSRRRTCPTTVAVRKDGGEIGQAQFAHPMAAKVEATVDMNPILLKPQGGASQVVVRGRVLRVQSAAEYWSSRRADLRPVVVDSLERKSFRMCRGVLELNPGRGTRPTAACFKRSCRAAPPIGLVPRSHPFSWTFLNEHDYQWSAQPEDLPEHP
jgi:hypothetical protein